MTKRKPPIEPKPTTYGGITFRSRLEARWAVFFDFSSNVLNWTYEPKTFRSSLGHDYTPDFFIKLYGWRATAGRQDPLYVEVKPNQATSQYEDYLRLVCQENRIVLLLVWGDFFSGEFWSKVFNRSKIVPMPLTKIFSGMEHGMYSAIHYRFDLKD